MEMNGIHKLNKWQYQQPTTYGTQSTQLNAAVCARVYFIHTFLLNNNNNYHLLTDCD